MAEPADVQDGSDDANADAAKPPKARRRKGNPVIAELMGTQAVKRAMLNHEASRAMF